jgi:(2R)-ethylmalonyl-CoA mutase
MADRPWMMGIYSGHSTPQASNELYRRNLARGQTRLSIAFDLPTQTGYDSDHPLAEGEVGKVGVPVTSIADMETLLAGIPLEKIGTNMTINAPAAWLLSLYVATAERRNIPRAALRGTTQNDIFKEYLSRGTYIYPPEPSRRLITDMIEFSLAEVPEWNPINVCSYHLQEVGATPVQEVAFALANAITVLDAVAADRRAAAFERISWFCNAGLRFIEEICKMRAFRALWERIGRERYGVTDPRALRFRYSVQVNSLGLTERQPENNIARIAYEALGVTLAKDARTLYLQLPAWNEALGLPRPWDQQVSLRIQQILAYETDILEYDDIFAGSHVIEAKTKQLEDAIWRELSHVLSIGGAVDAIESGYMKRALVESNAARIAAIDDGLRKVVGVNAFTEAEPAPWAKGEGQIFAVSDDAAREQIERLRAHRASRNADEVSSALVRLTECLKSGANVMPPSIRCAHAGVTTGEWADALRKVFTEYRAPTGLEATISWSRADLDTMRARVAEISEKLGRRLKLLVGKPGLDGHSSGAEQIALFAREAGFEVVYEGIRLTVDQIAASARQESVHLIGLSILSGSHMTLVPKLLAKVRVPVVIGGIIPEADGAALRERGVAAVYTPKDYDVSRIVREMIEITARAYGAE